MGVDPSQAQLLVSTRPSRHCTCTIGPGHQGIQSNLLRCIRPGPNGTCRVCEGRGATPHARSGRTRGPVRVRGWCPDRISGLLLPCYIRHAALRVRSERRARQMLAARGCRLGLVGCRRAVGLPHPHPHACTRATGLHGTARGSRGLKIAHRSVQGRLPAAGEGAEEWVLPIWRGSGGLGLAYMERERRLGSCLYGEGAEASRGRRGSPGSGGPSRLACPPPLQSDPWLA